MAEVLSTLSKIAGNFNPAIAAQHEAARRTDILERQQAGRERDRSDARMQKNLQVWKTSIDTIDAAIRARELDPAEGEAAKEKFYQAIEQVNGIQMPRPTIAPEARTGRNAAETNQFILEDIDSDIAKLAEEGGDAEQAQILGQRRAAMEASMAAKHHIIRDDVAGTVTAINQTTGDPAWQWNITPKVPNTGGASSRSGTFKSVFKVEGDKEVFVGDFDSKNPTLERFEGSNQYRVYNTGVGGETSTIRNPDGTSITTRRPPGTGLGKVSKRIEEQTLIGLQERRVKLERIAEQFKPEYLQFQTQAWNAVLNFVDKTPYGMPESQKEAFRKSKNFVRNAISQMNDYIRDMTGAAMGEAEAVRLRKAIADAEKDGPTSFIGKLNDTLAETKFAELRSWRRLHAGIEAPITDEDTLKKGMALGDPQSEGFGKGGDIGALLASAAATKEKELIELYGARPVGKAAIEFRKEVMTSVLRETFKVPPLEIKRYVR